MITGNPNLHEMISLARSRGAEVEVVPGTGDVVFRFPGLHPMRVNGRRKDSPRALVTWMRRLVSLTKEEKKP